MGIFNITERRVIRGFASTAALGRLLADEKDEELLARYCIMNNCDSTLFLIELLHAPFVALGRRSRFP